jgi:hypothetical protein
MFDEKAMEEVEEVEEIKDEPEYDVETPPEGWLSIEAAAEESGYQPQYVRRLLIDGKIDGDKFQQVGYRKWFVNPDSLEHYQKHSSRRGGMRRYVLRLDLDDEQEVRDLLNADGIEFELELAYQPKDEDEDEAGAESEIEDETEVAE